MPCKVNCEKGDGLSTCLWNWCVVNCLWQPTSFQFAGSHMLTPQWLPASLIASASFSPAHSPPLARIDCTWHQSDDVALSLTKANIPTYKSVYTKQPQGLSNVALPEQTHPMPDWQCDVFCPAASHGDLCYSSTQPLNIKSPPPRATEYLESFSSHLLKLFRVGLSVEAAIQSLISCC